MPFSLRISLRSQLQITALKGCFSNSFIFFICRSCSSSLVLKPMTVIDWLISLLPSSTLHFYNALITMISTFISGDRWISCIYDCLLCMDFFFFFQRAENCISSLFTFSYLQSCKPCSINHKCTWFLGVHALNLQQFGTESLLRH